VKSVTVPAFLWRAHAQSGFKKGIGRMECDQLGHAKSAARARSDHNAPVLPSGVWGKGMQKLPVAIGRVGRHRVRRPPLPSGEAIEHILRGHRLLTHSGGCGLHAYDHAAVVVHQIVVVVSQPRVASPD
jgi:hypothetical protein